MKSHRKNYVVNYYCKKEFCLQKNLQKFLVTTTNIAINSICLTVFVFLMRITTVKSSEYDEKINKRLMTPKKFPSFNLFVTAKTNSPIHKFKVLQNVFKIKNKA